MYRMYTRVKQENRPERLCEATSHPDNGQQASHPARQVARNTAGNVKFGIIRQNFKKCYQLEGVSGGVREGGKAKFDKFDKFRPNSRKSRQVKGRRKDRRERRRD